MIEEPNTSNCGNKMKTLKQNVGEASDENTV